MTRRISMTSRRLEVAERDGWWCHYCGIELIPDGMESAYCYWRDPVVSYDHCGCGKHAPGEACTSGGGWYVKRGYRVASPTVDHVVPLARGGTHDPENLVLACMACNCKKGVREWAA